MINISVTMDIRNYKPYFHIANDFMDNRNWLSLGVEEVEALSGLAGKLDRNQVIKLRDFLTKSLEEYAICQSQETTAIQKPSEMPKTEESPK